MTTLFIAEKPSMAKEIAENIGGATKKDGFFECSGGVVVTWLYGHILQMEGPEAYNEEYKQWKLEHLPILPEKWKNMVPNDKKKQFKIVKDLIKNATDIVNAGDPDREGQLLVDEVLHYVGNKAPVKRILLNALDATSVKKALADLRPNKDYEPLMKSALARQRADWLVGMNFTRAYTIKGRSAGHKTVMTVGRVKTPTLALIVRREREITNFKPVTFYDITADFAKNKSFTAKWQPREDQHGLDSEKRLTDSTAARALIAKLETSREHPGEIITFDTKRKTEAQRLPFSLSALQIAASKKYGYSAQQVLDGAQALYEAKLTTYPRSDCDYLPESQYSDSPEILTAIKKAGFADLEKWAETADPSIKSRAWNDSKVSAHHAIIPTRITPSGKLSEVEKNLYFLIAKAYVSQFYLPHIYDATEVVVAYADETFRATGRVTITAGWREIYGKEDGDQNEDNQTIPVLTKGDLVNYLTAEMAEKKTKPPERFTEGTLIQAMKEIHKYVQNPDTKKRLKDVSGIGTEATRAAILADLVKREFVKVEKKKLIPTEAAFALIDILPSSITYPDMTAVWESVLNSIANDHSSIDFFMKEQTAYVTHVVAEAKESTFVASKLAVQESKYKCPKCGKGLSLKPGKNGKKPFWSCSGYPDCKTTFTDKNGKPDLEGRKTDQTDDTSGEYYNCPECGNTLKKRKGPKGYFWGCSRFPECKTTIPDNEGKPNFEAKKAASEHGNGPQYSCPQCHKPLRKRPGKKGDFWGCTGYPECKASYNDKNDKPDLEGKK